MTDGQLLYLVLCLIYLSDCFLWLRKGSVVFTRQQGSWRAMVPPSLFSNSSGGLLFLNPIPPMRPHYVCDLLPVTFSSEGLCAGNVQNLSSAAPDHLAATSVPFSAVESVHLSANEVKVNGLAITKCRFPEQARDIEHVIRLMAAGGKDESPVTGFVSERFDNEKAAAAIASFDRETRRLAALCSAFFVFLYGLSPVLVLLFGLTRVILPLAFVMILFGVTISVIFFKTHRRLFPHGREERVFSTVKMALCPPTAIRAGDILSARALASYDPLTVASALPAAGPLKDFCRQYLLDLHYPLAPDKVDELGTSILASGREVLISTSQSNLAGLPNWPDSLLAPPPRQDPLARSYCPRCRSEFYLDGGVCRDCSGVKLVPFAPMVTLADKV
jgi:hypothetical protein